MKGRECHLHEVKLEDLCPGQMVVLTEATYIAEKVQVSGLVKKVEMEAGEVHLVLRALGAQSEALLRVHSADPVQNFTVHRCPVGCSLTETGERYLHGHRIRLLTDPSKEEPWMRNLEKAVEPAAKEDELEELRKRAELVAPGEAGVKEKRPKKVSSSSSSKRKKKKKKKKEKKEKKKGKVEAPDEGHLDGRRPVAAGVKDPKALFGGTGLDPREKIRKRVGRRAQRYVAKSKRSKGSSSSSSATSTGSSEESQIAPEGLFAETSKVRMVSERYPGVLAQESLRWMREALLVKQGEELEAPGVRPTVMMYYRQQLFGKVTPPMARELVTLATCADLLLKGKAASATDVVLQRFKSIEATVGGTHWSVSQRMEIPLAETSRVAQQGEIKNAQKDNYEESRTMWLASMPGSKGEKGKGKSDKGHKGKGDRDADRDVRKDSKKDKK